MQEDTILVAYNEIALKSKPVRRQMENQLVHHIENMLIRNGFKDFQSERTQGRFFIKGIESEKAKNVISKVFGVAAVMPSVKTTSKLDDVLKTALGLAPKIIKKGNTFAINVRRTGSHPYTSKDVENSLGEKILKDLSDRDVVVNLRNPDYTIHIEIRDDYSYIYSEVLKGPGGLTYGSQGKIIGLLSGGIDSPVAMWLMMKRGALVIPLVIDQRPYVGRDYLDRAFLVAKKLREYVPVSDFYLYVASTGMAMDKILEEAPKKFTCILCKRLMYRVASKVVLKESAFGTVTGENLGQVASQTLPNLSVLDEAVTIPIYRPLIGFEKYEITELAKRIGTYETSIKSVEECKALPSKPSTKANIEDVKKLERILGVEGLVEETLSGLTKISL